jgi:hypothetical protein
LGGGLGSVLNGASGVGFQAVKRMSELGQRGWFALGVGAALVGVACGQAARDGRQRPASNAGTAGGGVTNPGGTPGMTAGGALGGSDTPAAGSGGSTPFGGAEGGACQPEPACPDKVVEQRTSLSNPADAAKLVGVTRIESSLDITYSEGIAALSCLDSVKDSISIELPGVETLHLGGLRNLRSVGGVIQLHHYSGDALVECGFSRLESIGAALGNAAGFDATAHLLGELDLSALKQAGSIYLAETQLSSLVLPSDVRLNMAQLTLAKNSLLNDIKGFTGVTIGSEGISLEGTYSLLIEKNPLLSECRARELAAPFLTAGRDQAGIHIQENLACGSW